MIQQMITIKRQIGEKIEMNLYKQSVLADKSNSLKKEVMLIQMLKSRIRLELQPIKFPVKTPKTWFLALTVAEHLIRKLQIGTLKNAQISYINRNLHRLRSKLKKELRKENMNMDQLRNLYLAKQSQGSLVGLLKEHRSSKACTRSQI